MPRKKIAKKPPKGAIGKKVDRRDLRSSYGSTGCIVQGCGRANLAGRNLCDKHVMQHGEDKKQLADMERVVVKRQRTRSPGALS